MPERRIALQYEGRCRRCGHTLTVGTTASWNSDTKVVACISCPSAGVGSSPSPPRPAGSAGTPRPLTLSSTGSTAADSRWRRLVGYHLLAVQRAGVSEPPLVGNREEWTTLEVPREDLISGRGDTLPVGPALQALFAGAATGEAVFYGWPLLVLADRTGRLRAAPLLITELEPPAEHGEAVTVARDDSPYLNPGLLTDLFFPSDALAAADGFLSEALPFGDVEATRVRVVGVLESLGLDGSHLDPESLTSPGNARAGVHNTAAAFRGQSNLATRSLIEELAELRERGDWRQTAAGWLVDPPIAADRVAVTPIQRPEPAVVADAGLAAGLPPMMVESLQLNDSQELALAASRCDDLAVVTGPPGTGKSQLVGAVVVNQWLAGRSVLVASTNNGAVDVAVRRCAALDAALLVRTGNRELRDALPALLEQLASRGASPGVSRHLIRRQLEAGAAGRDEVLRRLGGRTCAEAELAQLVLDVEASRTLLWRSLGASPAHEQRSTLLLCAAKLASARWFRRARTRRLLTLAALTGPGATLADVIEWAAAESRADELIAHLADLGPADPFRDRSELAAADAAWAAAGTAALRDTVQDRLHTGRAALAQLARLRRAARGARVAAVARTLSHVPGWACTALSAQANFPLQAGLFDLLVIDEASQCSVANVLPLAYRARRILVVGDPNQLTPVVTLGRDALESVAAAAGSTSAAMHAASLSAGEDSAFTAYAARATGAPYLLDEHYRCHPEIARFFNEQFYSGALRILTDVDTSAGLRGLSLVDVSGTTQRGEGGGAFNRAESDAVVAWALAHPDELGSLGVVTPFAAQAALIRDRLRAALSPTVFEANGITVGTAHRFQGDEREVVLFSTVLATDVRAGTVRWVEEQRNLVNVAVSRARRALVVFADSAALADNPVPTLHALVDLARGAGEPVDVADVLNESRGLHSEAERRLFGALSLRGRVLRLKPVVEGYELDFALDTPAGPVNIEVDGIHHRDVRGRQRRQDLARDLVLERLGWKVVRVPAWRCLGAPDEAAEFVGRLLENTP